MQADLRARIKERLQFHHVGKGNCACVLQVFGGRERGVTVNLHPRMHARCNAGDAVFDDDASGRGDVEGFGCGKEDIRRRLGMWNFNPAEDRITELFCQLGDFQSKQDLLAGPV